MTILITGATRGIGLALAQSVADSGEQVIATYRGAPQSPRKGIEWHALDVTDPAAHRQLSSTLSAKPLSLLVCNAGVYLEKGHQLERDYPPADWTETFAVNVTGVFLTSHFGQHTNCFFTGRGNKTTGIDNHHIGLVGVRYQQMPL